MTHWKFLLTCKDGGYGWGETGDRAEMCALGATQEIAAEFVRRNIPGGWSMECLGKTEDTYYLRNLPRMAA